MFVTAWLDGGWKGTYSASLYLSSFDWTGRGVGGMCLLASNGDSDLRLLSGFLRAMSML